MIPRPTWIVIHSEQGHDHHDAFDYLDIDAEMASRGVHYDALGELTDDKPVVIRQWPVTRVGAHCRGWNGSPGHERSIGFSFAGNAQTDAPADYLLRKMAEFVVEAMRAYDIPLERVCRHKDMPGAKTDCPGAAFPWEKFVGMIRSELEAVA
jgi:N-acetyl-anhydromuramyl-L-alanine amidase AmpD